MKKYLYLLLPLLIFACKSDDSGDSSLPCDIPSATINDIERNSAFVAWTQSEASSATIEYGEAGFRLGDGMQATSSQSFQINNLMSGTSYDVYIKANCGNGGESNFGGPFNFMTIQCINNTNPSVFQVTQTEALFNYQQAFSENLRVEYGLEGFEPGTGTFMDLVSDPGVISGLTASTTYEAYVIVTCGNGEPDLYSPVFQFTTASLCAEPFSFSGSVFGTGNVSLFWDPAFGTSAWQVEYGFSGFPLGSGTVINTSENFIDVNGLQSGQTYEFYVRTNCGSEGFSSFLGPLPLVPN